MSDHCKVSLDGDLDQTAAQGRMLTDHECRSCRFIDLMICTETRRVL